MDFERFEVLEDRIAQAIKTVQTLRSENAKLRQQLEILESQNREKDEHIARLKEELGNVKDNVDESRQLKDREEKIRSKVEDMLAKLEELQLQF